jgi:hypothetical protein
MMLMKITSITSMKENSGVANQSIHEWDAEREMIAKPMAYAKVNDKDNN